MGSDVTDRPLRLGPDPNRTHLERWNEMHPDRYGRPDTYDEASSAWWKQNTAIDPGYGGTSESFLESLLGLAVLILAPLTGTIATFLIYRWTAPDQLTTGWMLGYAGIFLVTAWIGAVLVYAVRRLLLAAIIASVAFGVGYLAWSLWLS